MVDIESSIFAQVAKAFSASYPNGVRYSELTEAPAQFPALILYISDAYFSGYVGLDSKRIVVDVDIFSNLTSGAKQECKKIMSLVENALMSFGAWEQVFCNPIKNADQRIFRMKARYRGTAVQESDDNGNFLVRIYRK